PMCPRHQLACAVAVLLTGIAMAVEPGPAAVRDGPPAIRNVDTSGKGGDGEARDNMVQIPAGDHAPLIRTRDEPERVSVPAFWLDARPVTNGEFLEFVRAHPQWRRSAVSPLFADAGYLGDWAGDLEPGVRAPVNAPVVRVSWFRS